MASITDCKLQSHRQSTVGTRVSDMRQKVTTDVTRAICRQMRSFAFRWIGKFPELENRLNLRVFMVPPSMKNVTARGRNRSELHRREDEARANGIQSCFAEFQRFRPSFLGTSSHFSSFPKAFRRTKRRRQATRARPSNHQSPSSHLVIDKPPSLRV
jgi:hypothetical protein